MSDDTVKTQGKWEGCLRGIIKNKKKVSFMRTCMFENRGKV